MSSARPLAARAARRGFTLIELLVVIAIIAILAAILFPVFARTREKARQSACQSNLKQFMLGIMQYTQDYDEMMPLGISGKNQIGPKVAADNGRPEFSVPQLIMPYVKSQQVFQCPDDNSFNGGAPSVRDAAGTYTFAPSTKIWEAYGTSYKFLKQCFSTFPSTYTSGPLFNSSCSGSFKGCQGDESLVAPVGGATYNDPPFPLSVAFFARPTETRVLRCFVAPWETPVASGDPNLMHPNADIIAFADGHVKTVISQAQYDSYCDGPTASPARANDPSGKYGPTFGDGSCNTMGVERKKR